MAKICEVTGKKVMFGNNVSFSINKTKRRFDVNISKKRFYVPGEDRWVSALMDTSVQFTSVSFHIPSGVQNGA